MAETLRMLRERAAEAPDLCEEPAGPATAADARDREHQPLRQPTTNGRGPGPCSPVLDDLLVLPDERAVRTVVVAPAAPIAAAATAVRGIHAEAARRGLRTLSGRIEGPDRLLRVVLEAPDDAPRPPAPLEISAYEAAAGVARLEGWLADAVQENDLLVLAGPPLTVSTRAAAVAARCDGLLILAEAGTTARKDLRVAVAAARARGCHTFGVFVNEQPDRLTRWLSEL